MDSVRRKTVNEYAEQLQENIRIKNKKRFLKKLAFIFLAIFIFLGIIAFTKANNFFSVVNKNTNKDKLAIIFPMDTSLELYKDDNRVNFLMLGIRGEDDPEHGGLLTDTIMIASIDKKNKKMALISVPRDIYLEIPGTKKREKINAAYLIGEEKLRGGGGLEMSKRAIEYVTDLYIDYAVSADFKAFKEVVDELGGIDVYLDKPFSENKQWGVDFYVSNGWQHLNGDIALYYARSRYSTNDFDRARRQQQVLIAIKNKVAELGFLINPFKINSVLEILQDRILTDITIFDMVKYSRLIEQIGSDNIKHKVFSTEDGSLTQTYINGAYVLLPKDGTFENIRKTAREILE